MKIGYLLILVTLIVMGSCIPKQKLMYTHDQAPKEAINEYINIRPEKTIQPFDNIFIKVSSIDERTNSIFANQRGGPDANINLLSYTVSQTGYVDFPFVGEIYVKDMTLKAAQEAIEIKVSEYLPNISISVKFINNTVSVIGEVQRPGEYPFFRDQITIFQAISFAGGFKDFGNKENVILVREANNKINYHYLDLTNKNIVASDYYYIIPNDVIIVRPVKQKYRNMALANLPLFLATITTITTLYLVFGIPNN
jgi:polysaccharide biosynthesis/export protein